MALLSALWIDQPAQAQYCLSTPEAFRLELGRFTADLYALSEILDAFGSPVSAEFRQTAVVYDVAVREMTADDLLLLCDFFGRYPEVAEVAQMVSSVLESSSADRTAKATCLALSREEYLGLYSTLLFLQASEIAANAVCDASSCSAVVPPACVPVPECAVACPPVLVVSLLALVFEGLLVEDDRCGLINHYDAVEVFAEETSSVLADVGSELVGMAAVLDEPLSSRASQESVDGLQTEIDDRLEPLSGELATLLADFATLLSEQRDFREADRRLHIEENLQAGEVGQLSTLLLPVSLGGELETVREVVADAILMNLAAGENVDDALISFNKGDLALNQGNYRQAFLDYRRAYREAADLEEAAKR